MADCYHNLIVGKEVFGIKLLVAQANLGTALVAVLFFHLLQFVLNYLIAEFVVGKDLLVVSNASLQFLILLVEFVLLNVGELGEAHVHDCLSLEVVEREAFLERVAGSLRVLGGADNMDHLVDVVTRDDESFEDMRALLGLAEVEDGAAGHHVAAVLHESGDAVLERQRAGTAVHETDAVHGERGLQLRHLQKFIEHHVSVRVALDVDDDAHFLLAVALVVDIADALDFLFVHEFGDVANQFCLVHAVRYLGDNDRIVQLVGFDFGPCAHHDAAAPRFVGALHALHADDVAARGEVGGFHVFHQFGNGDIGIVNQGHAAVDHLSEVVGRHVRGHTHGDAARAVHEEVGDTRRHHRRLGQAVFKVHVHVDGLLFEVRHHGFAHAAKACLGVTHGCRRVAVHRTEVALPENERVAHVPVLRQAYERSVNGTVAVRVVFTHHVTHDTRGFTGRLVVRHAEFHHTI